VWVFLHFKEFLNSVFAYICERNQAVKLVACNSILRNISEPTVLLDDFD
jgi:hypothetical protein